jgi:diaminopimelate decarboxylase
MTSYFHYQQDQLFAEDVALADIAKTYGTPCYVYSRAALTDAYRQFAEAFKSRDHLICFAVKSNSNLAILNLFARLGAGFDIVSGGELQRVLAAGGDPNKVVFSGVGKTAVEMRLALEAEILCFNVESASELDRLNEVASSMGKIAPISLRVNPDVDAKTHPYISTGLKQNKFGVAYNEALALYRKAAAMPNLRVTGMDCHIGSQLVETSPFVAAAEKVLALLDQLEREGIKLEHLDMGGGLGIRYEDETPPSIEEYAQALLGALQSRSEKLIVEPGRVLVGNAGVLLTKVEYIKPGEEKHFAIVDAAMNDLMRPALYDAYHEILEVGGGAKSPLSNFPPEGERTVVKSDSLIYEVVGPICETGDFLGHARELEVKQGSLLAVMSAGAYGMSMSSNYNTRPRAAEVMVDGKLIHLIRERETVAQLLVGEKIIL